MSFHHGWLPREGFHADVLGSLITRTVLNPVLTVPLLLLTRYTSRGRDLALDYPRSASWLRVLSALSVLRAVTGWLNRRTLNNGVRDVYDWNREVVVVTGGADGIGKAITLMLASKGIKVAVLDIQEPTYTLPPTARFFKCNICRAADVDATAASLRSSLGAPTVLINNAGVCRGKPLLDTTEADVQLTFDVNAMSHYRLARAFVPAMVAADHGMVVTVASTAAYVTAPRMTEYAASKAAALAFHEGLAAELVAVHKARRVRTVVVNQGYTKTRLFQGFDVKEDAFVGPALHVDTVAQAIVEQVLSGESGQVVVPSVMKLVALNFRSLPTWLQVAGRAGMDNLMKDWKGRQVAGLDGE